MRRSALLLSLCFATGCAAAGKSAAPPPASPRESLDAEPTGGGEGEMKKTESVGDQQAQPGFGGSFAQPPESSLADAEALLDRGSKDLANALSSAKDCDTAKKALESMKRSAGRICDLNGPSDPGERCAKAKERVDRASENVRRGCGS